MIDKKLLWWAGGGAIAVSIAVAVTVNVVINDNTVSQSATGKQLSCTELQQAIDDIGRPGFDLLPGYIADSARSQSRDCNVTGKHWSIINGQLQMRRVGHTVIGDERSILDDFK